VTGHNAPSLHVLRQDVVGPLRRLDHCRAACAARVLTSA
jgi:hypothetical protein